MFLAAWAFLKSPLGKWLGIGVLVAAALGYLYFSGYRLGKSKGQEQQKQETAQNIIEPERQFDKSEMQSKVAEASQREQAAIALANQYARQAAVGKAEVQTLKAQLDAARKANASVSADDLDGKIHAQLRSHDPTEVPGYSVAEKREILDDVTAKPNLEAQNAKLVGVLADIEGQIAEQNKRIQAIEDKTQAVADYASKVERAYVELYNLHPPRKRSPKCIWLWKCADNRLPVPNPKDLLAARP